MAKRPPPTPPPVAAVANKGDLAHGLMLFAEMIAEHPKALVQHRATQLNIPMLGLDDLHVAHDDEHRVLVFTSGGDMETLTADECAGLGAFFARMAGLLREPRS